MLFRFVLFITISLSCFCSRDAHAQCGYLEQLKVTANDAVQGAAFGEAVALSGNLMIVGAKSPVGSVSDSAYICRFDGFEWVEEKKLIASDYDSGDEFGTAVAIRGDIPSLGLPWMAQLFLVLVQFTFIDTTAQIGLKSKS